MRASTIIVPHLEHEGQFDTSVARAVGWVLVMGASLVRAGARPNSQPPTPNFRLLAGDLLYVSTKEKIANSFALVPVRPATAPTAFVFNFGQTPSISGRKVAAGRGQRRVAMNDAERYRLNAAECPLATERCEPPYRGLTLAIAETWLSLARQQEAVDELLVFCCEDRSAMSTASSRQSCQYPRNLARLPLPGAAHARNSAPVQVGCDAL
jgi:hypothetical protein